MNRDRPAYADRQAFCILKCKYLPEGTDVHPFFADDMGVFILTLDALGGSGSTLAQGLITICASIIGLHKNRFIQILHPVADLTLDAHIRDFPEAVIVGAGTVAVQRVAVAVGAGHTYQCHKIDLAFQFSHCYSSSYSVIPLSVASFFLKNSLRCSSYPIR